MVDVDQLMAVQGHLAIVDHTSGELYTLPDDWARNLWTERGELCAHAVRRLEVTLHETVERVNEARREAAVATTKLRVAELTADAWRGRVMGCTWPFFFRPHRGGLAEAMAEMRIIESHNMFLRVCENHDPERQFGTYFREDLVEVAKYAPDMRIGWDTHAVKVRGHLIGFTDRAVPDFMRTTEESK